MQRRWGAMFLVTWHPQAIRRRSCIKGSRVVSQHHGNPMVAPLRMILLPSSVLTSPALCTQPPGNHAKPTTPPQVSASGNLHCILQTDMSTTTGASLASADQAEFTPPSPSTRKPNSRVRYVELGSEQLQNWLDGQCKQRPVIGRESLLISQLPIVEPLETCL